MPSIVISLWNKGIKLWDESQNPRPLRQMPDGRVGVVYRHAVFPVRGQNAVDISDPWQDPSDCPLIPVTNDVRRQWFLDTSGRAPYLVWRGNWRRDQSEVDDVVTALKSAGIQVRRHGPSTRPASNGIKYEWWVRLGDGESPSDEVLDEVFQIGGEPPLGPPGEALPEGLGIGGAKPRDPQPGLDDSDVVIVSKAELDRLQLLVDERLLYQQAVQRAAYFEAIVDASDKRLQQQGRELAEAKAELGNQQARWESERNGLLSKLKQALLMQSSELQGEFQSFGAHIQNSPDGKRIVIVAPIIKGSPAEAAGIKPGDLILTVDGEDTEGWSAIEAVSKIRGPKGIPVDLLIRRLNSGEEVTVRIVRGVQASEQIAALRAPQGMKPKDTQRLEDRMQEAVERAQAALAERDREAERAKKLQAEHADCDALLTDVENENTALKNEKAALDAVVAQLKTENNQLKSAEGMWRVQAQANNTDTARFVALVQQISVAIFPRVKFISDDIVTILMSSVSNARSNARSLLTQLREIDQGTAKGKKIAELDGWYETHFSTGEDDAGRVYWRQVGQDWYVYVGFKDGQQGDISKLRRWRPPR